MAADCGRQGQSVNCLGIMRAQRLVGGFGTMHALGKGAALDDPTIARLATTMNRTDLISFGRTETGVCRKGRAGADQTGQGGGKKQMRSHRVLISAISQR